MREAPAWLAEFQQGFSQVLRTPLGQLPASWRELDVLARSTRGAATGLADYQRQYWFRLINVLQTEFPLSLRLMGYEDFNRLAQSYLQAFAPADYDLHKVRTWFFNFLREHELPCYVMQAAELDEARAKALMAPTFVSWRAEAGEGRADLRLQAAPDWTLIREDWALVELNLRLPDGTDHAAFPCPPPHEKTQTWLVQGDQDGLVYRRLEPAQAGLYERLANHDLTSAVDLWAAEFPAEATPENLQAWMAQSVTWRLWLASQDEAARQSLCGN